MILKKFFIIFIVSCFVLSGASFVFSQEMNQKKALLIIAKKDFQDTEFAEPQKALKSAGINVIVASSSLDEATGTEGAKVTPDILLSNARVDDFDAIIFIGGPGAQEYLNDPVAHKLAQDAVLKNKILGGICLAPVILANAGVLKGKNGTCYPTEGQKLKDSNVNYTAKPLEIDGNIITADGPDSAREFGEAIVNALLKGGNL